MPKIIGSTTCTPFKPSQNAGSIVVDDVLNANSTNPVQNKVINDAFENVNTRLETVERGGGSITVDPTLSIEGQAADAKAVGDAFASATEEIGETLQAIATKLLPNVEDADNGKILQVENGKWTKADAPTGGGSITVDSEFSDTSENPVQNKVITAAMGEALSVLGELQSGLSQGEQAILFLNGEVTNLKTQMGDIETALDNIIAMQNSYIGGDA